MGVGVDIQQEMSAALEFNSQDFANRSLRK